MHMKSSTLFNFPRNHPNFHQQARASAPEVESPAPNGGGRQGVQGSLHKGMRRRRRKRQRRRRRKRQRQRRRTRHRGSRRKKSRHCVPVFCRILTSLFHFVVRKETAHFHVPSRSRCKEDAKHTFCIAIVWERSIGSGYSIFRFSGRRGRHRGGGGGSAWKETLPP